jgi:hypothetical protein
MLPDIQSDYFKLTIKVDRCRIKISKLWEKKTKYLYSNSSVNEQRPCK